MTTYADFSPCPNCKEYRWRISPVPHVCPPTYTVLCKDWHGNNPEDGDKIRANTAEDAACKFAEKYDQEDGELAYRGQSIDVIVFNADGKREYFSVGGEVVRNYYSKKRDPEPDELPEPEPEDTDE